MRQIATENVYYMRNHLARAIHVSTHLNTLYQPKLRGLLNTYLLFFDIVSSEPGPTTTVDPVWGYMPFRRTLKAVRGEVCVPS